MKKGSKGESAAKQKGQHSFTLGEYAHQVIKQQYQRIVRQEKHVLDAKDPEHLHQMRVGTRRLRTALQVFDIVIKLPKAARVRRLRKLAAVLGTVRDLDVQIASLRDEYQPALNKREQKQLAKALESLNDRRERATTKMKDVLSQPRYQDLKTAYEAWLQQPVYTLVEPLPLAATLSDLLNPLLSELLLHPGWLISTEQAAGANSAILHDLRKLCKQVRYQAEFFTTFYTKAFQDWIKEVKGLQDCLGKFQDTQILLELLADELGQTESLPGLRAIVQQKQADALENWEGTRQKYLDVDFRNHLRQMLLETRLLPQSRQPEPIAMNDTADLN